MFILTRQTQNLLLPRKVKQIQTIFCKYAKIEADRIAAEKAEASECAEKEEREDLRAKKLKQKSETSC